MKWAHLKSEKEFIEHNSSSWATRAPNKNELCTIQIQGRSFIPQGTQARQREGELSYLADFHKASQTHFHQRPVPLHHLIWAAWYGGKPPPTPVRHRRGDTEKVYSHTSSNGCKQRVQPQIASWMKLSNCHLENQLVVDWKAIFTPESQNLLNKYRHQVSVHKKHTNLSQHWME